MAELKIGAIISERLHRLPGFRHKHCHSCNEEIFALMSGDKVVTVDTEIELHKCKEERHGRRFSGTGNGNTRV